MGWVVRNPRFEMKEYEDGWGWLLFNDGIEVAGSMTMPLTLSKEDCLDFIRWMKYHLAEVPIIGGGVLEL